MNLLYMVAMIHPDSTRKESINPRKNGTVKNDRNYSSNIDLKSRQENLQVCLNPWIEAANKKYSIIKH